MVSKNETSAADVGEEGVQGVRKEVGNGPVLISGTGDPLLAPSAAMAIPARLDVFLGGTQIPFGKILELRRGAVVELETEAGAPLELRVNGKTVAYGEIVVVNDRFGVRVTEAFGGEA